MVMYVTRPALTQANKAVERFIFIVKNRIVQVKFIVKEMIFNC